MVHTSKFFEEKEGRFWGGETNVCLQLLEMCSFEVYLEESGSGSRLQKQSYGPLSLVGITLLETWMPIPRSITQNNFRR